MRIPTQRLFNLNTQLALINRVSSYIGDEGDEYNKLKDAIKKYDLKKVYKFDIGRNCDGFSSLISDVMGQTDLPKEAIENLVDYPDNHYRLLTSYLAQLYGISPGWFVIGSGLESIIDILARIFLSHNDKYLLPVPNFSIFEEFSSRTGAVPVFVQLEKSDNYCWTSRTTDEIIHCIKNFGPKMVWISNPINPTGQFVDHESLKAIIAAADQHNCFVVADEAYGEYTDGDDGVMSCYKFVNDHPNLVVLRTLSKIYGLPSIRLGHLVSKNEDLLKAVGLYRQYFPFSWFSLFVGQIAVVDQDYVTTSRNLNHIRRTQFFDQLDQLDGYEYLKSESCVFLLKSKTLTADNLEEKLMAKGIFVANHNSITGIKGENFVRVTIQKKDDNTYFVDTLKNLL